MATRESNIAAIERAAGMAWPDISAQLTAVGGDRADHAMLARAAQELFKGTVANAGWWAQSAAVAYEQEIGRRRPGQTADGRFQVGVSRTLPATPDEVLAGFMSLTAGLTAFDGVPFAGEPTTSTTAKWRYWRVKLADGTAVSVSITAKNTSTSVLAAQFSKLTDEAAVERWRTWFKSFIADL